MSPVMSKPVCHGCQQPNVEYHTLLCVRILVSHIICPFEVTNASSPRQGHSVCLLCREKIITGAEVTTPYEQCYHKSTSALAAEYVNHHDVVESFALALRLLPSPDDPNFLAVVRSSQECRHAFLLIQAQTINKYFPLGSNMVSARCKTLFSFLNTILHTEIARRICRTFGFPCRQRW
jgi:hypothetical protein